MDLLKFFLIPFSLLYGLLVGLRNKAFDLGVLKSKSFSLPIISVGNLSVGGSGKTPHVEYLLRLLNDSKSLGVLSRGYGRKTRGFKWVGAEDSPKEVGDEPLQYAQKFQSVKVAVQEDRVQGVKTLLKESLEVIVLDDAYQHRWVKPGLNILLTTYSNLYINDSLLPLGKLRESSSEAKRADIIVVSKSPKVFLPLDKHRLMEQIAPLSNQTLCFSYLDYSAPKALFSNKDVRLEEQEILLLTGIANAEPMIDYLVGKVSVVSHMKFKDHHNYSKKDVRKILREWEGIKSSKKLLLTTEKDAIRLREYVLEFSGVSIAYLPVEVRFHDETVFNELVLEYVNKDSTDS